MATCRGKHKGTSVCDREVCRCENCTNVGCDQDGDEACSNQGFRLGTCTKCGASRLGAEDLLTMTPGLERAIKKLRLSLP